MNGFGWLVLIVFALIWIVNNFLRNAQEERNTNRQRPAGGSSDGSRRPKTEIEQFLEEVNRRRRQKTESPQPVPREEEAAPLRTPLATRSARQQTRPQQTRRQRTAGASARSAAEREVERVILAEAVVVQPGDRPAVGQTKLGQLTSTPENPANPVQLTTMAPEIKAAPLTELTALLSSVQGMRAAMILQEVLGPPRCKRNAHQTTCPTASD